MSKSAEGMEEVNVVQMQPDAELKPKSCCVCMDVRIGTILIGLFNMVCHAFWIISLASYCLRQQREWRPTSEDNMSFFDHHNQHVNHNMVAMVLASLSFLMIVALIFGAALRRSNYMMPFFGMQVFDICLAVFLAGSFMKYAPQLKQHMEIAENVHGNCIRSMSLAHFRLLLFAAWMIVLMIKYYFATVVWDCIKHCQKAEQRVMMQRELSLPILLYQGDLETMNLLPTYDDVVKTNPPPAYAQ